MVCNKNQLTQGIREFINDDIIPGIQDKPIKMAIYAASQFPIFDLLLDKPATKIFLQESDDGSFNLDDAQNAIISTVDRFGSFPITIQPIPFISPGTIQISLTRADVDSLFRHIERMVNNG